MARAYTKYYPDPTKPITRDHAKLLITWGIWDEAKSRGVKVLREEPETTHERVEDGSGVPAQGKAHPEPAEAVTSASADEETDLDDAPYEEWTVEELRAELDERKLGKGGNKNELIAKLEKDDAAKSKA